MTIALRPKTRHFQAQLQILVFKLKRRMVPVDLFSKLKRVLFQKKTHLLFAVRENLKGCLDCQKIVSENGPHTKNGLLLFIFKRKKRIVKPSISTYFSA